jgi:hypothetical protein
MGVRVCMMHDMCDEWVWYLLLERSFERSLRTEKVGLKTKKRGQKIFFFICFWIWSCEEEDELFEVRGLDV